MENRPEFLCTWAGLAKLGVVVPLINPQLRGESLRFVLGAADTTWLLAGAECLPTLATVADAVRDWHVWVWAEDDTAAVELPPGAQRLDPALRDASTDNPPRDVRAGVLAGAGPLLHLHLRHDRLSQAGAHEPHARARRSATACPASPATGRAT